MGHLPCSYFSQFSSGQKISGLTPHCVTRGFTKLDILNIFMNLALEYLLPIKISTFEEPKHLWGFVPLCFGFLLWHCLSMFCGKAAAALSLQCLRVFMVGTFPFRDREPVCPPLSCRVTAMFPARETGLFLAVISDYGASGIWSVSAARGKERRRESNQSSLLLFSFLPPLLQIRVNTIWKFVCGLQGSLHCTHSWMPSGKGQGVGTWVVRVDYSERRKIQRAEGGVVNINTEMQKELQLCHLSIRLQILRIFVEWTR